MFDYAVIKINLIIMIKIILIAYLSKHVFGRAGIGPRHEFIEATKW